MSQHLQAIATLFSLVNPVVCAMIFANVAQGQSRAAAVRSATGAMLAVAVVLTLAAFLGAPLLKIFGVSLDAFSVAGGGVLVAIGAYMLKGQASSAPSAPGKGAAAPNIGRLVLFAASPGTITGVITITAAHHHGPVPVTALVAIAVVVAVTWAMLLLVGRRKGGGRPGLARDMVSRYMGLIIIAMGIQFALTGFKAFMAG